MNCELFIHWNPDLVFFHLGPLAVRWYGLCWLVGFAVAYLLVRRLYREQKIKDELFDPLFIYCFMGILLGARLGHCIFYEPDYFLTSVRGIIEMFLPIRFVDGNINYAGNWLFQLTGGAAAFVGYEGLASHGGTLGLMIALWLYVKKTKLNIWTVLDNIAIATQASSTRLLPMPSCSVSCGISTNECPRRLALVGTLVSAWHISSPSASS